MFPGYGKVTKKHQKTLTVQKDSTVLASIILILLYHAHTGFERRVEIINEAVPILLEQHGLVVPEKGRGYLWKFSKKQEKLLKERGNFVKTVLDESLRLRFHPDMDVTQVKERIEFFAKEHPLTTTPIKKSGKVPKRSQRSKRSADDVDNYTSALQVSPGEGEIDGVSSDDDKVVILQPIKGVLTAEVRKKCKAFDGHWKTCLGPVPVVSGDTAYGELNSGTAAMIWDSIHKLIGIKSTDTALDIGTGTGKFPHSRDFFCPIAGVKLMGRENVEPIYRKSQEILERYPLVDADLQFGDSAEVKEWKNVTIAYGYEGSPGTDLNPKHQTIMLTLLKTPSLRAICSTKMKEGVFLDYTKHDRAIRKNWVLVKIPDKKFGNSSHQVGSCYHCCYRIMLL
jgi:hypothetical protein